MYLSKIFWQLTSMESLFYVGSVLEVIIMHILWIMTARETGCLSMKGMCLQKHKVLKHVFFFIIIHTYRKVNKIKMYRSVVYKQQNVFNSE